MERKGGRREGLRRWKGEGREGGRGKRMEGRKDEEVGARERGRG